MKEFMRISAEGLSIHVLHYNIRPIMGYTADFNGCKMTIYCLTSYLILLFAQNIDCGYTLEPLSIQSLCFRAKCLDFVNCSIKSSHCLAFFLKAI